MRARQAACLLMVLTVAIAGCSSHKQAALPPAPVIAQTSDATAELTLPLDSYELSPAGNLQVQRALLRTIRDCMSSFGINLALSEVHATEYPTHATQLNWLGAYDVEKYGYQGPPGFSDEMSAAARRGSRPIVIPSDAIPVFFGDATHHSGKSIPAGGCDGESQRKLNGTEDPTKIAGIDPAIPPEQGIQWLEQQAADRARTDDRFREVVDQWSRCMNRRGYRYASPDEAQSDPRWNGPQESESVQPAPDEMATAIADRTCRAETNMSGMLKYLVSEQENEIIRVRVHAVQQVSLLLRTRAESAAAILGTTPVF
jgi:hypothetical protein